MVVLLVTVEKIYRCNIPQTLQVPKFIYTCELKLCLLVFREVHPPRRVNSPPSSWTGKTLFITKSRRVFKTCLGFCIYRGDRTFVFNWLCIIFEFKEFNLLMSSVMLLPFITILPAGYNVCSVNTFCSSSGDFKANLIKSCSINAESSLFISNK